MLKNEWEFVNFGQDFREPAKLYFLFADGFLSLSFFLFSSSSRNSMGQPMIDFQPVAFKRTSCAVAISFIIEIRFVGR